VRLAVFANHAFGREVLVDLHTHHRVALVITTEGSTGYRAARLHLPVIYWNPGDPGASVRLLRATLTALGVGPRLGVCAHWHHHVPAAARALFRQGVIGYHPSLLPSYRGRDAVQQQVADDVTWTGGTVYRLDDGWDTGEVLHTKAVQREAGADAGTLWRNTLAPLGVGMLRRTVTDLEVGDDGTASEVG